MSHKKNLNQVLADDEMTILVQTVIRTWGTLEVPVLVKAPPYALTDLALRSVDKLGESGALTADEGAELQARIRNLAGLSRVVIDAEPAARDGDSAARPTGPPPASVFDLISATLPDPSLFGFWDVVETVVVAVATAIGEALVPGIGGPVAGGLAALAWHEWVDPALMTA
jgi:hypothetical protein